MANYLEIDSKILENNLSLKFQGDAINNDDLDNFLLFPESSNNAAWKLVTPTAGFCIKTTDSNNSKVFINICQMDDIPEPKDISEAQLLELWQSEDTPDYRIPLSIQEPHDEFDKSGKPTVAYDVAINTKFFKKIQESSIFKSFVIQVVLEGIENKYNVELKKEAFVILQNRKSLGELKPHRIRTSKSTGTGTRSKPLIEEIHSTENTSQVERKEPYCTMPYRVFQNERTRSIVGEFRLPDIVSVKDVDLEVGENRLVVKFGHGYQPIDLFLHYRVDETKSEAKYNARNKILSVRMPVIPIPR